MIWLLFLVLSVSVCFYQFSLPKKRKKREYDVITMNVSLVFKNSTRNFTLSECCIPATFVGDSWVCNATLVKPKVMTSFYSFKAEFNLMGSIRRVSLILGDSLMSSNWFFWYSIHQFSFFIFDFCVFPCRTFLTFNLARSNLSISLSACVSLRQWHSVFFIFSGLLKCMSLRNQMMW